MMTTEEVLRQFPFYQQGAPAFRQELEGAVRGVALDEGSSTFHQGSQCAGVPLVGSGVVRVFRQGENGREITLYHVHPGEMCLVSLNSAITGALLPAWGVAETHVEAAVMPTDLFRQWLGRDANLRSAAWQVMAQRLTALMELIDGVVFQGLDHRLAQFLLDRAQGPERVVSLTHEQMATALGTAREVVSRLLAKLVRTGAVRVARGRVEVLEPESLERMR
jgi:CRP/FNR family transcriptional regulator, anaerobic regulatory protein